MKKSKFLRHLDFFIIDLLCLIVSFYASFIISFYVRYHHTNPFTDEIYRMVFVVELLTYFAVVYLTDPYNGILRRSAKEETRKIFVFNSICFVGTIVLLLFVKGVDAVSRIFFVTQYSVYLLFSIVARLLRKKRLYSRSVDAIENGDKTILLVVKEKEINSIIKDTYTSNYDNFRVVGLCVIDNDLKGKAVGPYDVVCNFNELVAYSCVQWIDGVYFALDFSDMPNSVVDSLNEAGITTYRKLIEINPNETRQNKIENLMNSLVLKSSVKEKTALEELIKKIIDIFGSLVGCLFAVLIGIIVGPVIKAKSPGAPVIYTQERIGLNGKKFKMYKFRSMVPNAEKHQEELEDKNISKDGLMFKVKDDPRIIPGIGSFIRKTSLDEFPQFFNVLKGDMSLVGTRPPTVNEWEKYELSHRIRMSIKPGITGMWQVSGRNDVMDFNEVVKLDTYYINNWSIILDFKILFKTAFKIFAKKNNAAM